MLGYDVDPAGGRLVINEKESGRVRDIFALFLQHHCLRTVVAELVRLRWKTKSWKSQNVTAHADRPFAKTSLRRLLTNAVYAGKVEHRGAMYAGEQAAIIEFPVWGTGSCRAPRQPARRRRSDSGATERVARRAAAVQKLPAADDPHLHGQAGAEVSLLRVRDGPPEGVEFLSHQNRCRPA